MSDRLCAVAVSGLGLLWDGSDDHADACELLLIMTQNLSERDIMTFLRDKHNTNFNNYQV